VEVEHLEEAHDTIKAVVERHGGSFDFGESGWLDVEIHQPVHGSAADEWFAEG
jgi:hypothetical protein